MKRALINALKHFEKFSEKYNDSNNYDDNKIQESIQDADPIDTKEESQNKNEPLKYTKEKERNVLVRNFRLSKTAIKNAKFKCEYDNSHITF